MESITVITSDKTLKDHIATCCATAGSDGFQAIFVDTTEKAIESLNYDLPGLTVIKLDDARIDSEKVIEALRVDPWLHACNVIVIHSENDEAILYEHFNDVNLVAAVHESNVEKHFFRVLTILQKHKQMIFQAGIHGILAQQFSCSYELGNDPFDTHIYANIIENFLFNMNLLKPKYRGSISVIIIELLMNAIEHGNCDISYDEKTEWMAGGRSIFELIEERNKDPDITKRKVIFSYTISPEKSSFTITDEGKGFDHKKYSEAKQQTNVLERHGRGIIMANFYASKLHYNDKGNACTFELNHLENENNTIPAIFQSSALQEFADGDLIFRENEESDDLYYIVSGKFNIVAKDKVISTLNNNDIFLGEMSFLLNSKRSATVIADGPARLIPISKRTFVNAIKDNPHYGIMLARLLAERLGRLSQLA